ADPGQCCPGGGQESRRAATCHFETARGGRELPGGDPVRELPIVSAEAIDNEVGAFDEEAPQPAAELEPMTDAAYVAEVEAETADSSAETAADEVGLSDTSEAPEAAMTAEAVAVAEPELPVEPMTAAEPAEVETPDDATASAEAEIPAEP